MVKVTVNLKGLKSFNKKIEELTRIDKKSAQTIGRIIVGETREMAKKGLSPIRGRGRFPGYKAVTEGRKHGYPMSVRGKFPDKRKRPVNLFLSGGFLKRLGFNVKRSKSGSWTTTVGWPDPTNRKKERGHREGANGQPSRPVIPVGRETYAVRIMSEVYDLLQRRVSRIRRTGR